MCFHIGPDPCNIYPARSSTWLARLSTNFRCSLNSCRNCTRWQLAGNKRITCMIYKYSGAHHFPGAMNLIVCDQAASMSASTLLIVCDQAASMSASTLSSNTVQNCARRDDKNHFLLSLWTIWSILQTHTGSSELFAQFLTAEAFLSSQYIGTHNGLHFQRIYISVSLTHSAIATIGNEILISLFLSSTIWSPSFLYHFHQLVLLKFICKKKPESFNQMCIVIQTKSLHDNGYQGYWMMTNCMLCWQIEPATKSLNPKRCFEIDIAYLQCNP